MEAVMVETYHDGDNELKEAVAFLKAELADSPQNAVAVDAKAAGLGISVATLARARARLGVITRQPPGCPRIWRMPKAEESDL
jgi:hypothetical protein